MPTEVNVRAFIRRATLEDAPSLALLDSVSRAEHWSLATYQEELSPQSVAARQRLAWVAERNSTVIAFAWFSLLGDTAELENIVVGESARRQGFAFSLLYLAHRELMKRGARVVQLEVRSKNAAALALYEKIGFKEDGRRPRYYKDDDAVLLSVGLNLVS